MAVKVMPDDYHSITPYLVVSGVATLLDFLTQAFEAHALHPLPRPDGTIMHPEARIGDTRMMMGEPMGDAWPLLGALSLYVHEEACTKEDSMPEGNEDVITPERAEATHMVVYTTLYDLIAAVDAEVEPGEEACVAPLVAPLLRAGHAQFLREVDVELLCADLVPACPQAEVLCVSA
jgi:uncharacterized glyoxalase superfamily protein PhnB